MELLEIARAHGSVIAKADPTMPKPQTRTRVKMPGVRSNDPAQPTFRLDDYLKQARADEAAAKHKQVEVRSPTAPSAAPQTKQGPVKRLRKIGQDARAAIKSPGFKRAAKVAGAGAAAAAAWKLGGKVPGGRSVAAGAAGALGVGYGAKKGLKYIADKYKALSTAKKLGVAAGVAGVAATAGAAYTKYHGLLGGAGGGGGRNRGKGRTGGGGPGGGGGSNSGGGGRKGRIFGRGPSGSGSGYPSGLAGRARGGALTPGDKKYIADTARSSVPYLAAAGGGAVVQGEVDRRRDRVVKAVTIEGEVLDSSTGERRRGSRAYSRQKARVRGFNTRHVRPKTAKVRVAARETAGFAVRHPAAVISGVGAGAAGVRVVREQVRAERQWRRQDEAWRKATRPVETVRAATRSAPKSAKGAVLVGAGAAGAAAGLGGLHAASKRRD